jgi:hypothetical protein
VLQRCLLGAGKAEQPAKALEGAHLSSGMLDWKIANLRTTGEGQVPLKNSRFM